MGALHRLADPLIGYDSIEALAPKERTLRRESVERVSQDSVVCMQRMCSAMLLTGLIYCSLDISILEFEIFNRTIHNTLGGHGCPRIIYRTLRDAERRNVS